MLHPIRTINWGLGMWLALYLSGEVSIRRDTSRGRCWARWLVGKWRLKFAKRCGLAERLIHFGPRLSAVSHTLRHAVLVWEQTRYISISRSRVPKSLREALHYAIRSLPKPMIDQHSDCSLWNPRQARVRQPRGRLQRWNPFVPKCLPLEFSVPDRSQRCKNVSSLRPGI